MVEQASSSSLILIMVIAILFVTVTFTRTASSEHSHDASTALRIARMSVSESINDREPIGDTKVFSSSLEKVYCFIEVRDISRDTFITFAWYYGEKSVAKVSLPVRRGMKWRTFSSKRLAGMKGDWRVEVTDNEGTILNSVKFIVE